MIATFAQGTDQFSDEDGGCGAGLSSACTARFGCMKVAAASLPRNPFRSAVKDCLPSLSATCGFQRFLQAYRYSSAVRVIRSVVIRFPLT